MASKHATSHLSEPEPSDRNGSVAASGIGGVVDLIHDVLRRWLLILVFVILALLASAAYLWIANPVYRADAVVAERSSVIDVDITPQVSAGRASLVDLVRKSNQTTTYDQFILLLHSKELAARLIRQSRWDLKLFPDEWNAEREAWQEPSSLAFRLTAWGKGLFNLPYWEQPGPTRVAKSLGKKLQITELPLGRMQKISVFDGDPQLALDLLRSVIDEADLLIKAGRRQLLSQLLTVTQEEMRKESNVSNRLALSEYAGKLQTRMLQTQVGDKFAITVIDSPRVSFVPVRPQFFPILLVGAFLGAFVGVLVAGALGARSRARP